MTVRSEFWLERKNGCEKCVQEDIFAKKYKPKLNHGVGLRQFSLNSIERTWSIGLCLSIPDWEGTTGMKKECYRSFDMRF